MDYTSQLVAFGIVLASLTVHEWAHAWTADRLGDPTARRLGRVSFNPAVHIDLLGTIVLPLIAIFSGLPILGWAKPVPVNTSRLGNPRRDFTLVAAAGPASNVLMALAAALVFRSFGGIESAGGALLPNLLVLAVSINILLAVFNMLPIPPLDGGNVLAGLLPGFQLFFGAAVDVTTLNELAIWGGTAAWECTSNCYYQADSQTEHDERG